MVLRTAPGGDPIEVLPDGTQLDQIGPDQNVNNVTWHHVRAPSGSEGWVSGQYTTEAH